jgi:hypothetical protein
MSIATPMASLTSLDHLFCLAAISGRPYQGQTRYLPNQLQNGSLILRPILVDAVIVELKRIFRGKPGAGTFP